MIPGAETVFRDLVFGYVRGSWDQGPLVPDGQAFDPDNASDVSTWSPAGHPRTPADLRAGVGFVVVRFEHVHSDPVVTGPDSPWLIWSAAWFEIRTPAARDTAAAEIQQATIAHLLTDLVHVHEPPPEDPTYLGGPMYVRTLYEDMPPAHHYRGEVDGWHQHATAIYVRRQQPAAS
ncbi:MAG: hypothetical protein AAGN66_16235 [Acidobacteriota bacterium]